MCCEEEEENEVTQSSLSCSCSKAAPPARAHLKAPGNWVWRYCWSTCSGLSQLCRGDRGWPGQLLQRKFRVFQPETVTASAAF